MQTNPNIILSGNQMAQPRLPDVNAMMQTRTAGLENIYNIEQQRAEQAKAAQKEQEAALVDALAPAYATAFKGRGSKEAVTAGYNLLPPEIQAAVKGQIDKWMAMPSDDLRLSALEASMAGSEAGRTLLTRIMTPYQEGMMGIQREQQDIARQRLAMERQAAAAEAQRGNKMEYDYRDEVDAEGNPTGRVIAFPKYSYGEEMPQGRIVGAEAGPIGAETPPNVVAPAGGGGVRVAPAKTVKEEDFTEREGKSLNFAIRMADSDNITNELEKEGVLTTDTVSNFFLGAVRALPTVAGGNLAEQLESAFNATAPTMSPEEQRLARAQLDFVTAVLRSESGAEIKTSEFPSEYRKYFAVAGDEKNTKLLADKKRARQNAIDGMKAQAGKRGAKEVERIVKSRSEAPVSAPAAPGETYEGFTYRGARGP